jgi:hypothetical protein
VSQIGEALFNRIMRAHRGGATFRVWVVMPLLPAFEGEVGAPSGTAMHAVTHWNYQSISRCTFSLSLSVQTPATSHHLSLALPLHPSTCLYRALSSPQCLVRRHSIRERKSKAVIDLFQNQRRSILVSQHKADWQQFGDLCSTNK